MTTPSTAPAPAVFTPYQKRVLAMLAFLQFTIILDFMVLSPLGAILMPALHITTEQFGWVVSGYAFSAAASGILAAGFADRFDRKHMLLFFYAGFLIGTVMCGLANTYVLLLFARMLTGVFGGVMGSIVMAITTDLFPMSARGRVMGVVATAFGASQVLGIPFGLKLATMFDWHMAFFMIAGVGLLATGFLVFGLKPINEHLKEPRRDNPMLHLVRTVAKPRYLQGFATTALMSTGGFMLMPFGSTFGVNNVGIAITDLPLLYVLSGVCAMTTGPIIGRFSDTLGKFRTYVAGSVVTVVMVLIYTNMGQSSFWTLLAVSVVMFSGVQSRMISAQALMSAVPMPKDRGAYMSVQASVQQTSGGLAAVVAGHLVVQSAAGPLVHFERLGYVMVLTTIFTVVMLRSIDRMVRGDTQAEPEAPQPPQPLTDPTPVPAAEG